jgi:competence protein ComEA
MPSEHRAVLILLALALAGHGARLVLLRPGEAPGGLRVLGAGAAASPAAHRDSALRLASPLAAGERIDVDRASARELTRLPRVGPALARKIVADREANGPFGSPEGLDRVPGVGEGLLRGLEGKVSFSGKARPAVQASISAYPAALPGPPAGTPSRPPAVPPSRPLDLNSATAGELDALPGIGPAKARAIVAYREAHGRFASVDAVARVPGIGPALAVRIRDALTVR